ncbi:hypothetical protein [uncultured Psychroserpens sp.]|uniref:hypothetical protein n=1 Tax=uncultured Psychroserpens sp. TaxID=255436 RepID=UPI0026385E75|nr:hypothetical protein [uncultured Psychroserpens sp.]
MLDYIPEIITSLLIIVLLLTLINILWTRDLVTSSKKNNLKNNTLGIYYLPKTIFVFSVKTTVLIEIDDDNNGEITSTKVSSQDFKVSQKIVSDLSHPLFLSYNNNPFADEEIKLKINDKGLLESFKGVSENKITDIIFSLTGFENEILSAKGNFLELSFKRKAKPIRIIERTYEKEFNIDSTDLLKTDQLIKWEIKVFSDKDIDISKKVDAGFSIKKAPTSNLDNVGRINLEKVNGLVFRLYDEAKIEVIGNTIGLSSNIFELSYINPNSSYTVKIRTTPFAKRVHDLIIKNGQLMEHSLNNPSSIVGFASIPIKVGKSLMSIPAQLINIQISNRKKSHELSKLDLKNKKELLDAEKELLNSKNELSQTRIYLNEFRNDAKVEIDRLDQIIRELKSRN